MGVHNVKIAFVHHNTRYCLLHLTWTLYLCIKIYTAVAFYGIFIYDFGERDHVFQPVSESFPSGLSGSLKEFN